ncbi:MAG: hypothetical protein NTX04_00595 [Verrucomicrobia bacterium]|nr:hypothetical protein [Verrucomicrobiota bacterium]
MNPITLPDSLLLQLRNFESRLRQLESRAAIAGGLVGLLTTFLLLFVFDRFGDTPRWARSILTLTSAALAAWLTKGWAHDWLWYRRGPAELGKILQSHFKSLGDRLQGVIELADTPHLPPHISPALMRAAIRQVADESTHFNFTDAVPTRPARRWSLAAIILLSLAAAPFVFAPLAATNALSRWLFPWKSIERYTFASLDDLPNELIVPHGEPFEVACGLKENSAWIPQTATARLNSASPTSASLDDHHRAIFRIQGQTRNGQLSLRIGDASHEITVRPLYRPELKELAAQITLPDYLGYPPAHQVIQGSKAEFLEGSSIRFSGKTSRHLQYAAMKSGDVDPPADLHDDSFLTPLTPLAEILGNATFRWTDQHGLEPTQPYTVKVSASKDAEPRIDLLGLDQSIAILPTEVLKLQFNATDDFGLQSTWLAWSVRPTGEKTETVSKGEIDRTPGSQKTKTLSKNTDFSPAWQNIPEDSVVEIAAYAADYLPNRKPSESSKHTIYVLSLAKHAENIRERMDETLKQLEDRIRDEERQLEESKNLAETKPDPANEKAAEKAAEDAKRAEANERANQAATQKLTEEMAAVMKDALRNKEIPESTLAEWQKVKDALEKKAAPPMDKAANALAQAAQKPADLQEKAAEAEKNQEEALAALKEAAKQMNKENENLYTRNFFNRMRAAATAEMKIAEGIKSIAKATLGLRSDENSQAHQLEFKHAASRQELTTKDVEGIANDMEAFIKRVPNEKYQAVQKSMEEKKVVNELHNLAEIVRSNLGLKSISKAIFWSKQLNEWATQLQKEKPPSKGEGEPQEADPDMMELVVAMVRAAQTQDNIREQTDLLEARKDASTQHPADSKKLANQESDLSDTLGILREKTKFAEVKPLLEKVEFLIDEAASNLRQAKTDPTVTAIQSTVIELLVPPDDKSKDDPSQSKPSSKMAEMIQKVAAQVTKSKTPGKNNQHEASSFTGKSTEGVLGQDKTGTRQVEKGSGATDAGSWPEEFRDQLQSYFQQLDGSK